MSFQIETCAKCGGMWLQAYILDKIILAVIAMMQRMLS
ncbi:MAG: zf-TFIIB domain-containing protein [Chloroflexi bacterium]|nr:zf-TFIIB domain-containing protein [Chloroflexota bacterium]